MEIKRIQNFKMAQNVNTKTIAKDFANEQKVNNNSTFGGGLDALVQYAINNQYLVNKHQQNVNFGMASRGAINAFFTDADDNSEVAKALKNFRALGVEARLAEKENENDENKIVLTNGYETNTKELDRLGITEEELFKHVKEVRGQFIPSRIRNLNIDRVEGLLIHDDSNVRTINIKSVGHASLYGKKLSTFKADSVKGYIDVYDCSNLQTIDVTGDVGSALLNGNKLKTFNAGSVIGQLQVDKDSGLRTINIRGAVGTAYLFGEKLKTFNAGSVTGKLQDWYHSTTTGITTTSGLNTINIRGAVENADLDGRKLSIFKADSVTNALNVGEHSCLSTVTARNIGMVQTLNNKAISYPNLANVGMWFLFKVYPKITNRNVHIEGDFAQLDAHGNHVKSYCD